MDKLPGNREIQPQFIVEYNKQWGDAIMQEAHPMSGVLQVELGAIPSSQDGFLPPELKVYLCHGQHRKAVLEESIGWALANDRFVRFKVPLPQKNHGFPLEDIHNHHDAFWVMDVYHHCKLWTYYFTSQAWRH
jgi:hypothetical protein